MRLINNLNEPEKCGAIEPMKLYDLRTIKSTPGLHVDDAVAASLAWSVNAQDLKR
jgi:hypothetical protein